jgi:carotenoid cleavage dioxygenase-like enzyme
MDLYQKERTHLVRTCKMAVDMGCAERTVQLAEDQGRLIAAVMNKIFNRPELSLTNAQRAVLGPIVREEMMALEAETPSTRSQRTS